MASRLTSALWINTQNFVRSHSELSISDTSLLCQELYRESEEHFALPLLIPAPVACKTWLLIACKIWLVGDARGRRCDWMCSEECQCYVLQYRSVWATEESFTTRSRIAKVKSSGAWTVWMWNDLAQLSGSAERVSFALLCGCLTPLSLHYIITECQTYPSCLRFNFSKCFCFLG